MKNQVIKISKVQAWPIVQKVFGDYKGRKFEVEFTACVTFHNTNWSGGIRNCYAAVSANSTYAQLNVLAPWNNPIEGAMVDLPQDVLIVKHTTFCGTDLGITIYAHPHHLPKWLESGQ